MSSARITALALGFALLISAPTRAAEVGFAQGPYVQHPDTARMTVVWATAAASAGAVHVGPVGGALDAVFPTADAALRHEVVVTGLAPGVTYHYQVVLADGTSSTPAPFVTAVEPGTPFRWVLFGDTRSAVDNHADIVAAIASESGIAFGVQTGDMVASGEVAAEWDAYFDIEQPLMRSVPVFPVIGNHDEHEGLATELVARFVAPENSSKPEHYYSFRHGNAWFTVLDGHASMLEFDGCLAERDLFVLDCMTPEQVDWVAEDLTEAAQAPGIDHIFALVHIGPYSSKENRSGSMDVRRLLPLFREMGVTAVLSGHDHYYERGLSAFGMPYVISGGAGASLYDISEPSTAPHEVMAGESVHHFVVVDVDGPDVTFTAKRVDGSVIDTFQIKEASECTVDADCAAVEPPPDCLEPGWCSIAKQCGFECAVEGANPFPELRPADDVEDGDATVDAEDADEPGPTPTPTPTPTPIEDAQGETPSGRSSGCLGGPGSPPISAAGLLLAWLARRRRGALDRG